MSWRFDMTRGLGRVGDGRHQAQAPAAVRTRQDFAAKVRRRSSAQATWRGRTAPVGGGDAYRFRIAETDVGPERDVVRLVDRFPGFLIDGSTITLRQAAGCAPYGVTRGCRFAEAGRHRKTPSWLADGDPVQVTCRVRARGEDCRAEAQLETVAVGGTCDPLMQPVAGVR